MSAGFVNHSTRRYSTAIRTGKPHLYRLGGFWRIWHPGRSNGADVE